jgi:hypothetical protein
MLESEIDLEALQAIFACIDWLLNRESKQKQGKEKAWQIRLRVVLLKKLRETNTSRGDVVVSYDYNQAKSPRNNQQEQEGHHHTWTIASRAGHRLTV